MTWSPLGRPLAGRALKTQSWTRQCLGQISAFLQRTLCASSTLTLADLVPFIFDGKTNASFTSIPFCCRYVFNWSLVVDSTSRETEKSQKFLLIGATPSRPTLSPFPMIGAIFLFFLAPASDHSHRKKDCPLSRTRFVWREK